MQTRDQELSIALIKSIKVQLTTKLELIHIFGNQNKMPEFVFFLATISCSLSNYYDLRILVAAGDDLRIFGRRRRPLRTFGRRRGPLTIFCRRRRPLKDSRSNGDIRGPIISKRFPPKVGLFLRFQQKYVKSNFLCNWTLIDLNSAMDSS